MNGRRTTETETPFFRALTQTVRRFFDEANLLRKLVKHELLSKWSPRHKNIRADSTNIGIPEELMQLKGLKVLPESVRSKGAMRLAEGSRLETCPTRDDNARRPGAEDESTKRPEKRKVLETEAANLALQGQAKLTIALQSRMRDIEATIVLHGVPPKRERWKRGARRRQGLQQHGDNPAKRGTGKPAHMVLQRNAESHRGDSRGQVEPESLGLR